MSAEREIGQLLEADEKPAAILNETRDCSRQQTCAAQAELGEAESVE